MFSLYDKRDDSASTRYPLYEKQSRGGRFSDLYRKRGEEQDDFLPYAETATRNPPKANPMEKPAVTTQRSPPPPTKSGLGARGQMNY